jgi:hypothetical protein
METSLPPEVGKSLICTECCKPFVLSKGEQDFFKRKGFAEPKRCKACRELRKRVDGVYGTRVVLVDSWTDLVLCNRCRNAASRSESFKKGDPICPLCAFAPDGEPPVEADQLLYTEWREHELEKKGRNPYATGL